MNTYIIIAEAGATGAPPSPPQEQAPDGLAGILGNPMVLIIAMMVLLWVLMIRPQRKAEKERNARISALKKGDKVITNAGIHGKVLHVGDSTVTLEISENVSIQLEKVAVVSVTKKDNV